MKNFFYEETPVRFYHICTDGENNGTVHICDKDYLMAVMMTAIKARQCDVRIICYCHMSTHSHFVISCERYEQAVKFIGSYKRDYGRYAFLEHDRMCIYRDVPATVKEICDVYYLKKCICYVLLNPVVPKVVVRPEDYRWSSFNAYFDNNREKSGYRKVRDISITECRAIFHTHIDLKEYGFVIDGNNDLVVKSFVEYEFVENLFKGKTEFYRFLDRTNSVTEEQIYAPTIVSFNDNELRAEASQLAEKRYGIIEVHKLTHDQKVSLLLSLRRKTGVTAARLARALELKASEVRMLLTHK